jgi:hypothetical protein
MASMLLEQLCADICERMQLAAPTLRAQQDGLVAFHFEHEGVTVNIVQDPEKSVDDAFVVFEFGHLGEGGTDTVDAAVALLHANFFAFQSDAPAFACHPSNGMVVLRVPLHLANATPQTVLDIVEDGVGLALQWRKNRFLGEHGFPAPSGQAHASSTGSFA